jgi:hypothetical protein
MTPHHCSAGYVPVARGCTASSVVALPADLVRSLDHDVKARVGHRTGDPIALIGPGSEWPWSMAQSVVAAVTLVGLYYQFRLQRAANSFEQLNRIAAERGSEPLQRARLRVARAAQAGQPAPAGAASLIGNSWATVASLVRGWPGSSQR